MSTHKDCGGDVYEYWGKTYQYETDEGKVIDVPALFCDKCGKEIVGDAQLDDPYA